MSGELWSLVCCNVTRFMAAIKRRWWLEGGAMDDFKLLSFHHFLADYYTILWRPNPGRRNALNVEWLFITDV